MHKKYKLAILASHPVQYQVPLFKAISNNPRIDLMVYFCCDYGITERLDREFNNVFSWDIPLLEGYRYTFLKNRAIIPSPFRFCGLFNPGIITELKNNRFDAVCVQGYVHSSCWLALLGAWFYGIPVIFRGEADLSNTRSGLKRIIKRALLPPLFKKIDAVLYSYKANREYYQYYGVHNDKLFFFPCAVDNMFWQNQAENLKNSKNDFKNKLGIAADSLVILFSGKFVPRKRPMDILRAYNILQGRQVKSSLVFVGDGQEADNLRNYTKDNKLENVYFAGFKNQMEISSFYSIADVFVIPSSRDPSPKAVNEAMNFGLPVVAADAVGTAGDLVISGENGFIYPTGDVNALADCLEKISKDKSTLARMGQKSREIVSQWSFEQDCQAILDVLDYTAHTPLVRKTQEQ